METIYLQLWKESTFDKDPILIGASLHLTEEDCLNYIKKIYKDRNMESKVPKKYTYKLGNYTKCEASKFLYDEIKAKKGTSFIKDHQINNLLLFNKLREITK